MGNPPRGAESAKRTLCSLLAGLPNVSSFSVSCTDGVQGGCQDQCCDAGAAIFLCLPSPSAAHAGRLRTGVLFPVPCLLSDVDFCTPGARDSASIHPSLSRMAWHPPSPCTGAQHTDTGMSRGHTYQWPSTLPSGHTNCTEKLYTAPCARKALLVPPLPPSPLPPNLWVQVPVSVGGVSLSTAFQPQSHETSPGYAKCGSRCRNGRAMRRTCTSRPPSVCS